MTGEYGKISLSSEVKYRRRLMDPLRLINGTGTFTCTSEVETDAGEPFVSAFTLSFFPDGSGKIRTEMFPMQLQMIILRGFSSPRFTTFSLSGKTEDGAAIEIEEIAATSPAAGSVFSTIIIRYPGECSGECDARYGMTNLLFMGCQYRDRDGGRSLDTVPLFLNGRVLELRRVLGYDKISEEMRSSRQTRVTAEVLSTFPFDDRGQWNEVVDDIGWLNSFAASEEVVPVYREFYFQSRLILCELLTRGRVQYTGGVAPIPLESPIPCSLKVFLESGYPRFTALRETLSLQGMFYLFTKSQHPQLALEVKYITMVMALESLCSYTEQILENDQRDVPKKSIERAENTIRKILKKQKLTLDESVIKEIAERAAFPHPDFKDKLQYTLQEFSVKYSKSDLGSNKTRNTIVHTGSFPPDCDAVEEYFALSNLLIRIILTILDYRGDYVKRGPGFPREPLPREL